MNFNIFQTKNPEHLPQYQRQQSLQGGLIRNPTHVLPISSSKNKTGHWNQKQNAKYYAFLAKFKEKFTQKEVRRQWKVFKALSEFIQSRNANQCRSHHHKMQKNFRTIEETLQYLKKKRPGIEELCERYRQQLEKLEDKVFGDKSYEKNKDNQNMHEQQAIEKNQIAENQIKNTQLQKKNLIPTSDKYDEENQSYPQNGEQYRGLLSKSGFDVFPSTGLLMNTFQNFPYSSYQGPIQSYSTINSRQLSMGSSFGMNKNSAYEQKLLQCHQCFIKWITKLKNLIQQQEMVKQKSNPPANDQFYYNFF